jgi:hypothetical protein
MILKDTSFLKGYKSDKRMTHSIILYISPFSDIVFYKSLSYPSCVPKRIMRFLKLPLHQNSIVINHKLNGNFKSHIIIGGRQE